MLDGATRCHCQICGLVHGGTGWGTGQETEGSYTYCRLIKFLIRNVFVVSAGHLCPGARTHGRRDRRQLAKHIAIWQMLMSCGQLAHSRPSRRSLYTRTNRQPHYWPRSQHHANAVSVYKQTDDDSGRSSGSSSLSPLTSLGMCRLEWEA